MISSTGMAKRTPIWVSLLAAVVALVIWDPLNVGEVGDGESGLQLPPRPDTSRFPEILSDRLAEAEQRSSIPAQSNDGLLELAYLYHSNGFSEEARSCYELLLNSPDEIQARAARFLADVEADFGNLSRAETLLQLTLTQFPRQVPTLLTLAEVQSKSGQPAAALETIHTILELDAENPYALTALAKSYMVRRDYDSAADVLEQVVTRNPEFYDAYGMLAQNLDALDHGYRAALVREKAENRKAPPINDPWSDDLWDSCYDPQRLSFLSEDLLKAGQIEESMAVLDRIESIDPKNWNAKYMRGVAYVRMFRYEDSVPHFRSALELGGEASLVFPQLVTALEKVDRPNEAEAAALEGLRVNPANASLLISLSKIELKRGNRDAAAGFLKEALAVDSNNREANWELSRLYWEDGEKDGAVKHLQNVQQVSPSDVPSRALIGEYFLDNGKPRDAIEPLEQAMALDPENDALKQLLSLAHMRTGNEAAKANDLEGAFAHYDAAIAARGSNIEARWNRVQLLVRTNQLEKAESAMSDIIAMYPRDPTLHLNLGDIQWSRGESAEAVTSWRTAQELLADGGTPEMREAIAHRLTQAGGK